MHKSLWELAPARGVLAWAAMALVLGGVGLGSAGGQTLTKTGTVTSGPDTGSTTQAVNGETVTYVIQYTNPSGTAVSLDLKDAIPTGTVFVPGSLQAPAQFSKEWSVNNGATWLTSEPVSGVTNTRAQTLNPILYSGGSGFLANLAAPPATTLTTAGASGDGYRAVPVNGNIYIINHHSGTTYLDCFSEATGTRCTNYPVHPSAVSGTAFSTSAYSTADANWTGTPGKPLEYVDRLNGKIYYPASDFNGHAGVMCVDVVNSISCGFAALYTASNLGVGGGTAFFPSYNALQPSASGRLYLILNNSGTMYCYDTVAAAACSGSPYSVPATTDSYSELSLVLGTKSIVSSPNSPAQVFCWDHATAALCAGWSTQSLAGNSYVQLYPVLNSSGTPTGVCVRGLTTFAKACFNVDGTSYAPPASFLAWMDNYVAGYYGSPVAPGYSYGDTAYYATRTFASGQPGSVGPWVEGCYDWSVPGDCAGNVGETWPVNGSNVTQRQYSTIADATLPGCMWMNGDDGIIGSFWAFDGGICGGRTGLLATVTPSDLTCDGLPHTITWSNITLFGLAPADYTSARVTIRDAGTGLPIPGFNNIAASFPLDISGISYATHPSIIVDIQFAGIASNASWSVTPPPYMTVSWSGPGPQVCFSVRPAGCATASLTNSAAMTTTPPGGSASTITANANAFTHILDAACASAGLITLTKEVCTDPIPANCTAISTNWVSSTTIPTGSTVSWRIKVTNTSAFDEARNITLTDAVAPSCVTAAGSFTLAPGASTTFVCTNPNVTVPTTNTATAGGTLVVAGVPPGTAGPPVTTNPGSASVTPQSVPSAGKGFAPNPILVGATSLLTITLTNPNASPVGSVAFADNYPANLFNTASPGAVTSCGGVVTAAANGTSVALTGGTIPAGASCTVTVNVTSAVGGAYVNTTGSIATDAGTVPAAQGTLTVLAPPTVLKSFNPNSIGVGGTSVLTVTLTNPNAATAITGAAFTDSYPSNLQNTATPNAVSTCGGSVTGAPGGTSVALNGGTIPAAGTCTVTINVTSNLPASYLNSTGLVTTGNAGNAGPASTSLVVNSTPFSVAKAFSPPVINPGDASVLSITLSNPNPGAVTGVAFTDNYPLNLINAGTPNVTSTCGGSVVGAPGGTSLALSSGTIPGNGSCTVSVTVTVTVGGTYLNSTGIVTSANAGSSGPATAVLSVAGVPIPTLSGWALALLAALLLISAALARRAGASADPAKRR